MVYTKNTKKALNIAYRAHMNTVGKDGVPYIFHPVHLAEQMDTEDECIVALLHDVAEDTDVTFEELDKEFSEGVMTALRLLTHSKEDNYMDYIKNLKANPIAKKVKLADLNHNMDKTRIDEVSEKDILRIEKYRKSMEILNDVVV